MQKMNILIMGIFPDKYMYVKDVGSKDFIFS